MAHPVDIRFMLMRSTKQPLLHWSTRLNTVLTSVPRMLLSEQKIVNKQGNMKVTNVSQDITEIFEVTGFTEVLNIE